MRSPRRAILADRKPDESRRQQADRLGIPEPTLRRMEKSNRWPSNEHVRAAHMRALGLRVLLLACACLSLSAVEWSRYDTQLHFTASAAGAYVMSDVLERTTDLQPWARFLISGATFTAASWAFEELNGSSGAYREANDAHAGTVGAWVGAGSQLGVSLLLTPERQALVMEWIF